MTLALVVWIAAIGAWMALWASQVAPLSRATKALLGVALLAPILGGGLGDAAPEPRPGRPAKPQAVRFTILAPEDLLGAGAIAPKGAPYAYGIYAPTPEEIDRGAKPFLVFTDRPANEAPDWLGAKTLLPGAAPGCRTPSVLGEPWRICIERADALPLAPAGGEGQTTAIRAFQGGGARGPKACFNDRGRNFCHLGDRVRPVRQ